MSGITPLSDADELLAAELALGLIDGDERHSAMRRLGEDPDFAAAYDRWTLHRLANAPHGQVPQPSVWSTIERKLPANDCAATTRPRQVSRWWQATAIAATTATAVLALALVRDRPVPAKPVVAQIAQRDLVAVLTAADSSAVVIVSFDAATGRLMWAPARLKVGDKVPELWVIPADKRPRSLGVIGVNGPGASRRPSSAVTALAADATAAISLEPVGGSPTGAPTGPVIVSGKFSLI